MIEIKEIDITSLVDKDKMKDKLDKMTYLVNDVIKEVNCLCCRSKKLYPVNQEWEIIEDVIYRHGKDYSKIDILTTCYTCIDRIKEYGSLLEDGDIEGYYLNSIYITRDNNNLSITIPDVGKIDVEIDRGRIIECSIVEELGKYLLVLRCRIGYHDYYLDRDTLDRIDNGMTVVFDDNTLIRAVVDIPHQDREDVDLIPIYSIINDYLETIRSMKVLANTLAKYFLIHGRKVTDKLRHEYICKCDIMWDKANYLVDVSESIRCRILHDIIKMYRDGVSDVVIDRWMDEIRIPGGVLDTDHGKLLIPDIGVLDIDPWIEDIDGAVESIRLIGSSIHSLTVIVSLNKTLKRKDIIRQLRANHLSVSRYMTITGGKYEWRIRFDQRWYRTRREKRIKWKWVKRSLDTKYFIHTGETI